MTNQEFIDNLSSQAKHIIFDYDYKNPQRDKINVFITKNRSQLNTSIPDRYIIEVKQKSNFHQMEYEFLHEFFHCVQIDSGFPYVQATSSEYTKLAAAISSVVLDLDVTERLNNVNYFYNQKDLTESINTMKKLILISKTDTITNNFIYEINQYIYMCCKIAFIKFLYDKPHEIEQLLNILKINAKDMYKSQSIIYNSIKRIGYNTPQNVYKLFKTLIRELKLEGYIKIS